MNLGGPWHDLGPFSVVNDFDVFASVHAWSTSNAAGVWPFLPQCNWIQQESCRICLVEGFSKSWAIREVGDSHFGKKCCTFLKKWCTSFLKRWCTFFRKRDTFVKMGPQFPKQVMHFFFACPRLPPKKWCAVFHWSATQRSNAETKWTCQPVDRWCLSEEVSCNPAIHNRLSKSYV